MSSVAQAALGAIDAGGGARGARWRISTSSSIAQRTYGSTAAAAEGCGSAPPSRLAPVLRRRTPLGLPTALLLPCFFGDVRAGCADARKLARGESLVAARARKLARGESLVSHALRPPRLLGAPVAEALLLTLRTMLVWERASSGLVRLLLLLLRPPGGGHAGLLCRPAPCCRLEALAAGVVAPASASSAMVFGPTYTSSVGITMMMSSVISGGGSGAVQRGKSSSGGCRIAILNQVLNLEILVHTPTTCKVHAKSQVKSSQVKASWLPVIGSVSQSVMGCLLFM